MTEELIETKLKKYPKKGQIKINKIKTETEIIKVKTTKNQDKLIYSNLKKAFKKSISEHKKAIKEAKKEIKIARLEYKLSKLNKEK